MLIEIEMDDTVNSYDEDEKIWYENEIFIGDRSLLLHSNEIGDTIGEVTSVTGIKWIP
jgi:hypothetical protein